MAEWSRDRQEHAVVEVTSLGTSLAHENRQEHAIRGKLGNGKLGNGKFGNHFIGGVGKVGNGS